MLEPNENFSRLDLAFAGFLTQRVTASLDSNQKDHLRTLLAILSQQNSQGHSCLKINDTDKNLLVAAGLTPESQIASSKQHPLIIEDNRLYLQRYWHYEDRLAKQITQLSQCYLPNDKLESSLDHYFGDNSDKIDWQREAAKKAIQYTFCIITGGPGTGKTTTVCKILALLQELSEHPLAIALAAPTGKAAMRLQESIAISAEKLECTDIIKQYIPRTAVTLHRLLGTKPPSPYFYHNADNPLIFDLVIVDEASMIDLALMSKLVDALKTNARLILLGDKDQLASVESGFVLGDLISALPNNTVELTQSYRFDNDIKKLADAVNQQSWQTGWSLLASGQNTPESNLGLIETSNLINYIGIKRGHYLKAVNASAEFMEIYTIFNQFQVLCANRHGDFGALAINQLVERQLFKQNANKHSGPWYKGRPVMVLQNNPTLHLYNGDIGICLPDSELNGVLMVFFQRPDGSIKKYPPSRLPSCETAFAMTIHKSQGSEFDEVLIVLPETVNPVLSKELIYTGITRAKTAVKLVTNKTVFAAAIDNQVTRSTGLGIKLQKTGKLATEVI